jgi:N-acetyl-gamma-glutamyl-phosphate/LysW-gamma-L-alpha-aminoadipyl-6-phosphate reductase
MINAALLHGAGYAGGELIAWLQHHPEISLRVVTSRTFAGKPVGVVHRKLVGQTDLCFSAPEAMDGMDIDLVFLAAEHGQAAQTVADLVASGYAGRIVDLSADFRFRDLSVYPTFFGYEHAFPALSAQFVYRLPEVSSPWDGATPFIANPGCFATGITVALAPLVRQFGVTKASVTAVTGASGSGQRPRETTHYPTRDGNMRAYKVLSHQHTPEIEAALDGAVDVSFIPVSGPFTRGIWGTVTVDMPQGSRQSHVMDAYQSAYATGLVRVHPTGLPELGGVTHTPFVDVGLEAKGDTLVVVFALDNLLKGAATQAIQNANEVLSLPTALGLIPHVNR